jgi:hypothetical protein
MTYELHLTLLIVSIAVFWICCGVLAYGACRAYFVREFDKVRDDDPILTMLMGVGGPVALTALAISGCFKHGFMFRNPHRKGAK